jgi:hypothetical protein
MTVDQRCPVEVTNDSLPNLTADSAGDLTPALHMRVRRSSTSSLSSLSTIDSNIFSPTDTLTLHLSMSNDDEQVEENHNNQSESSSEASAIVPSRHNISSSTISNPHTCLYMEPVALRTRAALRARRQMEQTLTSPDPNTSQVDLTPGVDEHAQTPESPPADNSDTRHGLKEQDTADGPIRLRRPVNDRYLSLHKDKPLGTPEIWAMRRQALCDALPYFKSHQGSLYTVDLVPFGLLISGQARDRDMFDGQVIITTM